MRTTIWFAALMIATLVGRAGADEPAVLKSTNDKTSYVVGVDMARNFKRQGMDVDIESLVKGLRDGMTGEKLMIPEADFRQSLIMIQNEIRARQRMAGHTAVEINKSRGAAFLAENKTKEGVTALPSGLQYRILKAGDGKKPAAGDMVECNYRGTRLDGTQFAGSNPGQAIAFKVSEAPVTGWREVLPLMPQGSKWQLFVPPQLAYGNTGVGRDVGPNETVIFELELTGVK